MSEDSEDPVKHLIEEGDEYLNAEDWTSAIRRYEEAINLIPEPREDATNSLEAFAALGDAHFCAGQFSEALQALRFAIKCPGGVDNPFIHLRMGQSFFEIGDFESAAKELTSAYMLGDREIFDGEDERYLNFLSSRIKM